MSRAEARRSSSVIGLAFVALATALLAAPLGAQPIEVTAADPDSAEQGTANLDVTITGDGFAKGAAVRFLLTGTEDPGGIQVNDVRVRGPKKLIANIDVDEDAFVSDFDIEVSLRSRVGKGTELFAVLEASNGGPDVATCDTLRDDPADRVMSDGRGQYCNSEHQVVALIGSNFGGHVLDTKKSGREVFLDFGLCANDDGTPCGGPPFLVTEVNFTIDNENDTDGIHLLQMLVGQEEEVGVLFALRDGNRKEVRLSFGRLTGSVVCRDIYGNLDPGDKVTVRRVALDSWTFESTPGERACLSQFLRGNNSTPTALGFFYMPFHLTVTAEP